MFDLQIITPKDLNNANFGSSEYVLQKGELFGIPAPHVPNSNKMETGCRLYIGNGETPIKGLRYIGRDIDDGKITDSEITGGTISNATLRGGFNCSGATLVSGKLMAFDFDGCNIPIDRTLTNNGTIDNTSGTITGGTISNNAFISGNSATNITGGKIAGSDIIFSKGVTVADTTYPDVGFLGNMGSPGQEKFFSSTGYPAYTNFGGTTLRCLDIKGNTIIDETGKFNTRNALMDGKLGYDDDNYHTVIQNTDLSVGNKFPSSINTNATSADYLNSNVLSFSLTPIGGDTQYTHIGRINDVEDLLNKDTIFYLYSYDANTSTHSSVSPIYIPHELFSELTLQNDTAILYTTSGKIEISAIYNVQGGILNGFYISINFDAIESLSYVKGIYISLN